MPRSSQEWIEFKKELFAALKAEYVTVKECVNKKESYVRMDLCKVQTDEIKNDVNSINAHLHQIDIKLGNHIEHIVADNIVKTNQITQINATLTTLSESIERLHKNPQTNKTEFKISKPLWVGLIGLIITLMGLVVYLIEHKGVI